MQWSTGCLRLLLCGAGLQVLLSSSVLCWQWDTGGGSTGWWSLPPSLPPSLLPPTTTMRCLHNPQHRISPELRHTKQHTLASKLNFTFFTLINFSTGKYFYFVCLKKINICSRKIRESGVAVRDPPFLPPAESWSHGWTETSRDIWTLFLFIITHYKIFRMLLQL